MQEFYQTSTNSYFKNNKNLIYGFIIGLFLLLTVFKQSIGLPILFLFIITIGGLTKPSKEYLIIAGLLTFKIIIISIITKNNLHEINLDNIKILIRRIIIDVILLFMLFVALKDETKKGFYYFCIALFFVDLTFNIYAHFFGVSIYGVPLEIRHGDLIGRSGGFLGHSFYSIYISLIALFCGILFKNRLIVLLAVVNIFLSGAQRGAVSLALIAVLYLLLFFKANRALIFAVLVGYIMAIFLGVAYLANSNVELTSHNERIFSWQYGLDVIASNLGNFNSYIRFQPEVFQPHLEWLVNSQYNLGHTLYEFNAEGYYLSEMVNYGLLVGFISIIIFYFFYKQNLNRMSSESAKEYLPIVLFSCFIFLDSFYSYSIASTLMIFFYAIFVLQKQNDNLKSKIKLM
jgi:hypothetical protein